MCLPEWKWACIVQGLMLPSLLKGQQQGRALILAHFCYALHATNLHLFALRVYCAACRPVVQQ